MFAILALRHQKKALFKSLYEINSKVSRRDGDVLIIYTRSMSQEANEKSPNAQGKAEEIANKAGGVCPGFDALVTDIGY